jgi:hypothetical protein
MKLSLAHEQVCNLTHHQFYLMALVLIVIVESQEDQAASCICHGFQRTLHKTAKNNKKTQSQDFVKHTTTT